MLASPPSDQAEHVRRWTNWNPKIGWPWMGGMQTMDTSRRTSLLLERGEALLVRSVIHEVALGSLGRSHFERAIGYTYEAAPGLEARIDEAMAQAGDSSIAMVVTPDELTLVTRCLGWALDDFAGEEFQIRVGFSRELAEEQRAAWTRLTDG